MATDRSMMTVRVVPLRSREAGDARVDGTVAARVALVGKLTELSWALTGQPLPEYSRATMPVCITSLPTTPDRT